MNYYVEAFKRFSDFSGRSSRAAYWYFVLFNIIVYIILSVIDNFVFGYSFTEGGFAILSNLYSLILIIPGIALAIRRLHDIGKSGWWLLVSFVPVVGILILLIFYLRKGDAGSNMYGSNPDSGNSVPTPPDATDSSTVPTEQASQTPTQ